MNTNEIIAKVNEIEATLAEIKAELVRQTKPYRLAFVNFFAGGKSYAYTADDSIAEGDIVYVPTTSRGNIAGVVVYTERYSAEELPFQNTKTVIGKLDAIDTLTASDIVSMTSELAPAIADKEASKGRLIAFLARKAARVEANTVPFPTITDNDDEENEVRPATMSPVDDDGWDEGDPMVAVGSGEPEPTVTDSSTELPY